MDVGIPACRLLILYEMPDLHDTQRSPLHFGDLLLLVGVV